MKMVGELCEACEENNLDEIKSLITLGADVSAEEYIAIQIAAGEGHLEAIKILTDHIQKIPLAAIKQASEGGHLPVVKYLIESSYDFDINKCYRSIIIPACWKGHVEIVRYLIEKGENIEVFGPLALYSAARNGCIEVVKYLSELGVDPECSKHNAFETAAAWGHLNVVKYWIDVGIDVSKKDIMYYDPEIYEYFLSAAGREMKKLTVFLLLNIKLCGAIHKDLALYVLNRNMYFKLLLGLGK